MQYLKIFSNSQIDAIGLSFVQNKKIIKKIKKKFPKLILISKVENSEGLKNVNEISKFSDAIMIDRGDLSAEIGDYNLCKGIIIKFLHTVKSIKPLIMVKRKNLESLYHNNNPSKNDIVSLGHSKQVQSDIIMLSEETAVSQKWKKIFTWLTRFIHSTKNNKTTKYSEKIFWEIAKFTKNYTLVLFTKHGVMFNKNFQDNLENDVIVFTDQKRTYNLTKYYKNTHCILTKKI